MSAIFVAFLAAGGIATWVYTKLQQRTGYGNNQNAYVGAGVVFLVVFLIVFTVFKMVQSATE